MPLTGLGLGQGPSLPALGVLVLDLTEAALLALGGMTAFCCCR